MQEIKICSRICLREGVQVGVCGRKHVPSGSCERQYLCNLTNSRCGRWIRDCVRNAAKWLRSLDSSALALQFTAFTVGFSNHLCLQVISRHLPPTPDRVFVCPPPFVGGYNLIHALSARKSKTFVATFVQFGLQMYELWVCSLGNQCFLPRESLHFLDIHLFPQ